MRDTWIFDSERFASDFKKFCQESSYRYVATMLPYSSSTLWRIATNNKDITVDELIRCCHAMKCDPLQYFDVDELQLRML